MKGFTLGQLARLERDYEYIGAPADAWRTLFHILGWPDHFTPEAYDFAEVRAMQTWEAAEMKRRSKNEDVAGANE